MSKTVTIPDRITVSELAEQLGIDVTQLITELVKNGVMATLNDTIDFETAEIIMGDLELDEEVELKKAEETEAEEPVAKRPDREIAQSAEHTSELQSRENLVCRLLPEKKKHNLT